MNFVFRKAYTPYYIIATVFVTLFFVAEIVNDRFWLNDFKVYYFSALDFIQNDPIYEKPYGLGSGWFKYSPFFAMLFSFFTLFSYKVASMIFYWIVAVLIVLFLPKIYELMSANGKKANIALSLCFVFIADHLVRELHLGNVNFLLLVLSYFIFIFYKSDKIILSTIFFAIVILLKPYFMLLGLFFLLNKEFKYILTSGVFVILFLLLPSLFVGFEGNQSLLLDWVEAMRNHNSEITSFNYLAGTLKLHFGWDISILIFIIIFVLSYVVLFFKFLKNNIQLSFFILIAIIPNLVLTDTEHFLYSIPLILYFIDTVIKRVKIDMYTILGVIGLMMYGLNWGFVWGGHTGYVVTSGIIGLGNLLIISSVLILQYKSLQSEN